MDTLLACRACQGFSHYTATCVPVPSIAHAALACESPMEPMPSRYSTIAVHLLPLRVYRAIDVSRSCAVECLCAWSHLALSDAVWRANGFWP